MSEQAGQPLKPEKKVYDNDHKCPIKEARLAKLKGRPQSPIRKWLNRLLLVFIGIPVIALLGFVGAISLIDFNQYKPQIEAEFQKMLGYEMNIQGGIEVTPLPFSLQVNQIILKNPPGFSRENLAQIQSLRASLSLTSLFLQRRLDFLGVEFDSPQLYLEVLSSGQKNWQGIKNHLLHAVDNQPSQSGFQKVADPLVADGSSEEALFSWRLDSLIWQNSRVEWVNQQTLTSWTLEKFDLMAFDLTPNQPFKLITNFDLTTSLMAADVSAHLTSWLTLNNRLSQWQLTDWVGNVRLMLPVTAGVPETRVELAGDAASFSSENNLFHVKRAQFRSLESTVMTDFSGSIQAGAVSHQGKMIAKQINLRHWFRHAGIALPMFINDQALTDFSVSLDWSQAPDQLSIEQLVLQLDGSVLQGSVWRKTPAKTGASPKLQFDLTLEGLDLETYRSEIKMPSSDSQSKPSEAGMKTETYLPIGLPIATLQALNAQGQLQGKQLKWWQMQIDTLDLTFAANQGHLTLAPLDATLYGGTLRAKLQLDVTGSTPAYEGSAKFIDLKLLPFLSDGWKMQQLEGILNGHFDFATQGVNGILLTQNMHGNLAVDIRQGHLKGIDFNKLLAGQISSAASKTAFSELKLKSHIQKGRLVLDRLNLNSERFSAIGTGQLSMLKGTFDGKLFTTYHTPPASLETFAGLEIPIKIKGPIEQLRWTLELEKLMNSSANQQKLFERLNNVMGQSVR